jgi:PAS domain-containing protein
MAWGDRNARKVPASPRKERRVHEFGQRLLGGIPDGINVIDLDGKLRYMNQPGRALMEIDDFDHLEGRDWLEFWKGPYEEIARAAMEVARAGKYSHFQGSAPTAKGTAPASGEHRRETQTIPILFAATADPVASGIERPDR